MSCALNIVLMFCAQNGYPRKAFIHIFGGSHFQTAPYDVKLEAYASKGIYFVLVLRVAFFFDHCLMLFERLVSSYVYL